MPSPNKKSFLQKHGFTCNDIKEIALKDIGSRKKLECLVAKNNGVATIFFISVGKSRVLKGEFENLESLKKAVEEFEHVPIEKKVYFHSAQICSKAFKYAEKLGWNTIDVSL